MKAEKEEPPRWILNFLRSFCPPRLVEEIEGDLLERFNHHRRTIGINRAKRKMLWAVIRFFRPGILLRNKFSMDLGFLNMLASHFKVSLRVLFRNKAFSAINVSGLVLGMTGALLLYSWIRHEFSFEQFHSNKEQLYMAWNRATENGKIHCWPTTPRILAATLQHDYASVEHAISYAQWRSTHLFTVGDKKILKTSGVFTDPAILTVLSFPLLKGDPRSALSNPNSIVITQGFARQLFGEEEAFGESVTIVQSGYRFDFTVSGILDELPSNTSFDFEYLISFKFLESLGEKNDFWGNNSVATIVQLKQGADIDSFNREIRDIVKKHYADGQHIEMFLYPLTKMRLYSRFENGVPAGGRIEVMRLLAVLGIFLIAIACINFINLCTARAQRRAKEVAIRKVTGAFRLSLITQFLCESVLMAIIAGVISLAACYYLLPAFSTLVAQNISMELTNPDFWIIAAAFIIGVGLLAGSYPAFYLSSFQSVPILKGLKIKVSGGNAVRSGLVVFQFGFALTLIASALVLSRQIDFVQNRDAGYSSDHLVHMPLSADLIEHFEAFRHELLSEGTVTSITKMSAPITERWSGTTGMSWRGKDPLDKTNIERIYVDEHIVKTAGLTLLQGRDMDLSRFPSDSSAVLLNETALHLMGFENPIGEVITDGNHQWHVIGVVKDFVFTSPFQSVEPILLFGSKSKWALNVVYLKLNASNPVQENIADLSVANRKYNPEYPFEYHFADLEYQRKFDDVNATWRLTAVTTSVAIFIACLGLFGLALYMTEVRMKEIGVRKVMGGSAVAIAKLLAFSSIRPILIAVLVFTPVSWLAMDWWLESFAYRTSLDAGPFILAAASILFLALLTISAQTTKAARVNPVMTLRNE
ncbi:MAG TPA: ABC transporter permease [Chryseosolibacter sp.]|nr:ABC transporter permease [Chryseosolibacter sp.]